MFVMPVPGPQIARPGCALKVTRTVVSSTASTSVIGPLSGA